MVPERKENSFCFGCGERVAGKGRAAAAKGSGGDQHNGGARGRGAASHGSRGCKTSIRVRASTASAAATAAAAATEAAHQSTTTATTLNSQPASHQQQQKPKPSTNKQTNKQPTNNTGKYFLNLFPLAAWPQPLNPNPCPPHLQHLPTTVAVCPPNYLRPASNSSSAPLVSFLFPCLLSCFPLELGFALWVMETALLLPA